MSAFVVSKSHIDALVTLAVKGPGTGGNWLTLHWYERRDDHGQEALIHNRADYDTADELGRMLWAENARSVAYRYGARTVVGDYVWPMGAPRLSAVEGLKAIDCYEYQACEHDEWKDSAAKQFCDALRRALITYLPGYDDAAWAISGVPA